MSESLARILYDSVNSRVAKFIDDSGDSLLSVASKLRNVAGAIVNPATEDKQDDAITQLTAIDSVLDSIKDTDGIKKITDALPAGTNEIGAVAQGTKAEGSAAWPTVLYDAEGNPVRVHHEGNQFLVSTRDEEQLVVLSKVLQELRKTNFYLSQLVGVDMPGYGLKED